MSYSIVKRYISVSTSRVLDIACGYGAGTKEILDSGACEVVGADVSPRLIDYCKNTDTIDVQLDNRIIILDDE